MPITNQQMVDIANAIRNESDAYYQSLVPVATLANIGGIANPLTTYTVLANSFITALINRIGLTIVHSKMLVNKLAGLKTGELPLGSDIQEIYVNPVEPNDFDPDAASDLLAVYKPDARVAYHRMNSQKRFDVTVSQQQLRQAFVSWDALAKFVDGIMNSIYSGMYKYEFETTKAVLTGCFGTNAIVKQAISAPVDAATAKAFVKQARKYFSLFQFPRTDCNAYALYTGTSGVTTWTNPEDIRLIITAEAMANLDVDVMAAAFNLDKTTLLGQIIEVDSFYDNDIVAIMCDKAFVQIWDVLEELRPFDNGATLSYNYYLHKWQVYSTSLFANAVAFHTGDFGELTVTSAAGTATGDSNITISGGGAGTKKYKLGKDTAPYVSYRQDVSDWTDFTAGNFAAATLGDNEFITVVETNTEGEAIKAGYTELTKKAAT